MAVAFPREKALLANNVALQNILPADLKRALLQSEGAAFIDALATASLLPGCTEEIIRLFPEWTTEITGRWSQHGKPHSISESINILSAFSKILPLAKYLTPRVCTFLGDQQLRSVLHDHTAPKADVSVTDLAKLLLAIFRLLSAEPSHFQDVAKPTCLSFFLSSNSMPVRYLAVQCLSEVMHFADDMSEKLVLKHIGTGPIVGDWEGKQIDFRLLKLLEEKRWMELMSESESSGADLKDKVDDFEGVSDDFSLSVLSANVGGVLLPRNVPLQITETCFISTLTASRNLRKIGAALLCAKSILIAGPSGSGKTTLINEAARLVNQQASLVTLHLNEQTDGKSLIGLYTSSSSGDSFTWQPGVLTKAMQEGRWILIEDIDRAPSEVVGVLKPVIENGLLFVPSRNEYIQSADGFRVLATTKASSSISDAVSRTSWTANSRLWTKVYVSGYKADEITHLLDLRYPKIIPLLPEVVEAYKRISDAYLNNPAFRKAQSRTPSLRDLLKWCRRISERLVALGQERFQGSLPETFKYDIFMDAVDCYAALQADATVYEETTKILAQSLNISPQQMAYLLNPSTTKFNETESQVFVGRSAINKLVSRRVRPSSTFAMTSYARRNLESVGACINFSEPLLLVGETGVGKTTVVQRLASMVGQSLVVVNLSQQSESTDLIGGLKPVTTRSIVMPVVDQFNTLFDDTFSTKRNAKFQLAITKALEKQNWKRLFLLWQEAIQMAEKAFNKPLESNDSVNGHEQASKRRKITSKHVLLSDRWAEFALIVNQVRTQIARSNSQTHTFAFVEGRLVQAVRQGQWLLLDEINLASADTLDHIVGLLKNGADGAPSLLLTESGGIQQVVAHPSFRIFAAMNPATDTGKKDLAPGIRSRFTEIYVKPDDHNINDLVLVVNSYIGSSLSNDRQAASDLAKSYQELVSLNEQHVLTDGAGEVPHFSLRTLVRSLLYVREHSSTHGLRRSMYEGFAMSFFTILNRTSEELAFSYLKGHLFSNLRNAKSFLSQRPKFHYDEKKFVAFEHHLVHRGSETPDTQPHYIRTPSVERNLLNLARATSMRRFPILLQGPTSAGKTSMVEYLAKFSGNKFIRVNNHEHTDLQEYLGSYATNENGKLEFREGVLVEALRKGHWIVLDELNLAPSDVLEALNRLLDDNRELLIPESQEIVRPHPSFMLFATQNPAGLYGGRKRLSRAFRNRFLELHFDDIPEDELEVILRERSPIAPSFCTQIVQVYKKLSLQRQATRLFEQKTSFATLRDLFRWASRPVDDRQQLAYQGFMLLAERVRDAGERDLVRRTIEETMRVQIDEGVLYNLSRIPLSAQSSTLVWTPAMIRLFVLVSEALKNNEPVLLIGETGCGKTQICQTVSACLGRDLSIYNAHSNTETGDLLGSHRPIRQRAELTTALTECFSQFPKSASWSGLNEDSSIERLVTAFEQMESSDVDPQLIARTKQCIRAYQSLFEWSDGSLIRSMKAGEHFLLDEISLADDSVLERLNSVLEPSRTILLAEKGPVDNLVIAGDGFQFLATMNPGGDFGKRELSAALRNRLTEIWVPPLSDARDVLPIIESRLGPKLCEIAPRLLDFASWFCQNMQTTAARAVPLRSLLAWSDFINTANLTTELAFLHGAALVFVDSLGANPAGLTNLNGNVDAARKGCLDKLQSLAGNTDTVATYFSTPELRFEDDKLHIGAFSMSRGRATSANELVFDAPTTLKNAMRILRALQMKRPILIEGDPGVGKTAIVTSLATLTGKSFTRINLSDQTDLMDLFGADTPTENEDLGRFSWRDGPLLQAMQSGGWVLLDEMNLASQSVLEGLNSCLDHRQEVYIAELDKSFTCHPEFTLFAAQNPHQQGGGRKGLPASFVNRFTVVYAEPFTKDDLLQICSVKRPNTSVNDIRSVIDTISSVQHTILSSPSLGLGGPWELNLRDANRWLDLCDHNRGIVPSHHFEALIAQRFRSLAAKSLIYKVRDESFKGVHESVFHPHLSTLAYEVGTSFMKRHPYLQHVTSRRTIPTTHLRYAQSIMMAINHGWPVLLVGGSGSGKTSLVRGLAALKGTKLIEFPLNADTDTMDLIGGFEQYDPRRDLLKLQSDLCETLLTVLCQQMDEHGSPSEASSSLLSLLKAYEECSGRDINLDLISKWIQNLGQNFPQIHKLNAQVRQLKHVLDDKSPRFVWNDGTLIDALQTGAWLVLDNANLCNPSVLDRLNSLLEPNGSLTISEHHSSALGERTIYPHPDFKIFLTMDPKYGELSRAMRNRSLELFLENELEMVKHTAAPKFPSVASISVLRHVSAMNIEKDGSSFSIAPYVSMMSSSDQELIYSQAHNVCEPNCCGALKSQLECWQSLPEPVHSKISKYYSEIDEALDSNISEIASSQQPLLPVLNDALISFNPSLGPNAEALSRTILKELQFQDLKRQLATMKVATNKNSHGEVTILQQSAATLTRITQRSAKVLPAYQFVQLFMQGCETLMTTNHVAGMETQSMMVDLAEEMFLFFNQQEIDFAKMQAYLQIIQESVSKIMIGGHDAGRTFRKALELLKYQHGLQSGESFQRAWAKWKSLALANEEQYEALRSTHDLIREFDELTGTLRGPRVELAKIRLQLTGIHRNILKDPYPQRMIQELANVIKSIGNRAQRSKYGKSQFTTVFDWIIRKLVLQDMAVNSFEFQKLLLLSLQNDSSLLDYSGNLFVQRLKRLAFFNSHPQHDRSETKRYGARDINFQLVSAIEAISDVSIGSLSQVQEEVEQLIYHLCRHSQKIGTDTTSSIASAILDMIRFIMTCHESALTSQARFCISTNQQMGGLKDISIDEVFSQDKTDYDHLLQVYDQYLHPVLETLCSPSHIGLREVGVAMSMVCFGALKLFVPDRAFDPATHPMLVKERHEVKKQQLQILIASARSFQQNVTDQTTSTLIRMFEHDVTSLGIPPVVPSVFRPSQSQMTHVQEVFYNIVENLLKRDETLKSLSQQGRNSTASIIALLQGIDQLIDRLSKIHRAYDDVTMPVSWLLQSFELGLEMTMAAERPTTSIAQDAILSHCPIVGSEPANIMSWSLRPGDQLTISPGDSMHIIEHLLLETSIEAHDHTTASHRIIDFLTMVDISYEQWKINLSKDQADAEEKARYYTYRGQGEQNEAEQDSEMKQLFPTFDDNDGDDNHDRISGETGYDTKSGESLYEARRSAIKLANLHIALLNPGPSDLATENHIATSVREWSKHISGGNLQSNGTFELLPSIVMMLKTQMQKITTRTSSSAINIYSNTDITEVKDILNIVDQIQARFEDIAAHWPEQATPVEVLGFCQAFLEFKITEPIAKLLTKAEKLLEIIAQWQSVASRDWSVTNLIEALTAKIVHWRRLELMSWSRLLDAERQKVEEDAHAWYFVAYEAVFHNTKSIIDQNGDVPAYCAELMKTMQDFLRSADIGQFSYRLRLLKTFETTLAFVAQHEPRFSQVVTCLSGIRYHYERYENNIVQILHNGRIELEKNVSEQIKLATWKDVNVQSLRDSARRSHHKLFKIIKKYRAMLAQPIASFTAASRNAANDVQITRLSASQQVVEGMAMASERCARNVPDWQQRPSRLIATLEASTSMRKLYTASFTPLEVHHLLGDMADSIRSTAGDLRKSTPDTLNEENASLVRHLRERKRRLLGDTMKNLSFIGVRRNLGTSELGKQMSTPNVLTYSPDIEPIHASGFAREANHAFHEMLSNMSEVRLALRDHSNDLTDGEVARCSGLLEGLLSFLAKQRIGLTEAAKTLNNMSRTIQLVNNVQKHGSENLLHTTSSFRSKAEYYRQRAPWACQIMRTAGQVFSVDSEFTKSSISGAVDIMKTQSERITQITEKINEHEASSVPGLTTKDLVELIDSLETAFAFTKKELQVVESNEPNVIYVLCKVLPWLQAFDESHPSENGIVYVSVGQFDQACCKVLDKMFVALQQIASIQGSMPISNEEQGWLLKSDTVLSRGLQVNLSARISEGLNGIIHQLQYLTSDDLSVGIDILTVASPIIEQYLYIVSHWYQVHEAAHVRAAQLGVLLSKYFISLAKEGFCTPSEPSDGQDDQNGKLESGTGLGEGEGAEDISKDVGDDEDLSELAQNATQEQKDHPDIDKSKDAVDMGNDDLEGQEGSDDEHEAESDNGDKSSDDDEGEDMDEEVGSVDELDSSAVDEKLWDDMRKESDKEEKEMKSQTQNGTKDNDETAKDQTERDQGGDEDQQNEASSSENEDENNEGAQKMESEALDPHLEEQEALELPEDMQIGGDEAKEGDISDDGMDEFSDVEQESKADKSEVDDPKAIDGTAGDDLNEDDSSSMNEDGDRSEEHAGQDENIEDTEENENDKQDNLKSQDDEIAYDIGEQDTAESGVANQDKAQDGGEESSHPQNQNDAKEVANEQQAQSGKGSEKEHHGEASLGLAQRGGGREDQDQRRQDDGLRRLADLLDEFHRRREILAPAEEIKQDERDKDQEIDMADADFEHLAHDEDVSDTQALGSANADQAQSLDQNKAIEDQSTDIDHDLPMPDDQDVPDPQSQEETMVERFSRLQAQPRKEQREDLSDNHMDGVNHVEQLNDPVLDKDTDMLMDDDEINSQNPLETPSNLILDQAQQENSPSQLPLMSTSDATTLWAHCSVRTHTLSLLLTEQLRLILAPTKATKLRGDFRTGKRLNIKRIIPYIASGYKRDKIWMRRSVPSKRNYQVMIAVDDSKSMSESGADLLAFETVAMLSKSLSMLEVGELCVVNFGEEDHVRVAHPFDRPFTTPDSGVEVFRNFSFKQQGTDVRRLVRDSIQIFQEARLRAGQQSSSSGGGGTDLWQLGLIVSDGHCSDHNTVRRLVRSAQEQRIVMVFVIVDAGQDSIVDLKEAVFERVDPADESSEMKVKTKRYLEGFPFQYYVVVRDVADLPAVLARVLKGWFESVVDTQ